jgi:hypothetical protein
MLISYDFAKNLKKIWFAFGNANKMSKLECSSQRETRKDARLRVHWRQPVTHPDVLVASYAGANNKTGALKVRAIRRNDHKDENAAVPPCRGSVSRSFSSSRSRTKIALQFSIVSKGTPLLHTHSLTHTYIHTPLYQNQNLPAALSLCDWNDV